MVELPIDSPVSRTWRGRPFLRSFSIVELVMVVTILSILAAVAVPRFSSSLTRQRVAAAARRVAHDLSLARRSARAGSVTRVIAFDLSTDRYRVGGVGSLDRAAGAYEVWLADEPYEVEIVKVDFDGETRVTFDGWGVPASGGTVVVGTRGQQWKIVLDVDTGQTEVSELTVLLEIAEPG